MYIVNVTMFDGQISIPLQGYILTFNLYYAMKHIRFVPDFCQNSIADF